MTSSLLCVSFMIGGVGLGVEEEVCSAIKGDISPLFCCDEEKKIDNHATFKPCIVLDCHSLLPKQSFKLQLSSATGEEHPQMCIRHRQNSKRTRVGTAVDFLKILKSLDGVYGTIFPILTVPYPLILILVWKCTASHVF